MIGGYKTEVKEIIEERERLALRNKVKEKHFEIYRELREDIAIKTYMHGPMDYAKKLKLRLISCRGPGSKLRLIPCRGPGPIPERKRYTSSREEEDVTTHHMCPCRTKIE